MTSAWKKLFRGSGDQRVVSDNKSCLGWEALLKSLVRHSTQQVYGRQSGMASIQFALRFRSSTCVASSLQAPCKPIASRYISIASHENVHVQNAGFETFWGFKTPPEYPLYNIKRGKYEKKGRSEP